MSSHRDQGVLGGEGIFVGENAEADGGRGGVYDGQELSDRRIGSRV